MTTSPQTHGEPAGAAIVRPRAQTIAEMVHLTQNEADVVLLALAGLRMTVHSKLSLLRASELTAQDDTAYEALLDELEALEILSGKVSDVLMYYRGIEPRRSAATTRSTQP